MTTVDDLWTVHLGGSFFQVVARSFLRIIFSLHPINVMRSDSFPYLIEYPHPPFCSCNITFPSYIYFEYIIHITTF